MLHVYKNTDELLNGLAAHFVSLANKAITDNGRFSIALSGGSSPKKLYELLATQTYRNQLDWSKVYFFFGDERNVPADDADNNALMVSKALFEPLNIADDHIFRIPTAFAPSEAALLYTEEIDNFFREESKASFDLVLLGLGDNAHTASLFPHTKILHNTDASVQAVLLPEQEVYRISFTAPLINQAKNIAFLVYGAGKAEAVRNVLKYGTDVEEYPAQLIRPNADWFLDDSAAALVK